MKMRDILNMALSDWEEEIAASAFIIGATAQELSLHPMNEVRIDRALQGLRNLPRRTATELALEALTIGVRRV
jgi:hypothetical protein